MNLMKQQVDSIQQRKGPGRPPRVASPVPVSPPSPDYVAPPPRPGPGRPPADRYPIFSDFSDSESEPKKRKKRKSQLKSRRKSTNQVKNF